MTGRNSARPARPADAARPARPALVRAEATAAAGDRLARRAAGPGGRTGSAPAVRPGGPGSGPPDQPAAGPWPAGFMLLLALVAVLNLIGLVMVLSASSVESLRQYGSPWYY